MAKIDNAAAAAEILAAVGGKENVAAVTHCMTRLRFNLKDEGKSSDDALKQINGVIQVVHAGNQVQVVIGPGVDRVYDEVLKAMGGAPASTGEEIAPAKQKRTPKVVVNNIFGALSGSITPILPVFIVAGIFKMIATLLGPDNIGLLAEDNQIYILCNLVNDGCFYFLPFFAAYSAAKKFQANPVFAMIITAVMLHPSMLSLVEAGEPFRVYNIVPM